MDDAQPHEPTAPQAGQPADAGKLSDRDDRVLRFERRTWRYPAAKDEAIRTEFGFSPARYYQLLNALIESPAALAAEPVLVGRLSRLRAARRQGWSPAASVSVGSGRAPSGGALTPSSPSPDGDRAATITTTSVRASQAAASPAAQDDEPNDDTGTDVVEPYPTDPA
ncbi:MULTISPECIES: DUF3263 domain-containing protein [unclassified Frankia]|uniref:DUF3263 domain-containing protein n=1 Tax=unclassified Frankia TaxID=2632575 RepID=UPI0027DC61EC|nr:MULTISPECIES: DUF3263 domain-containing protein [unclassified Frankia]